MLVRLIGGLLLVASVLLLGLYWAVCSLAKPPAPLEVIPCLLKLIPATLGFFVLVRAKSIAEWVSNLLDD